VNQGFELKGILGNQIHNLFSFSFQLSNKKPSQNKNTFTQIIAESTSLHELRLYTNNPSGREREREREENKHKKLCTKNFRAFKIRNEKRRLKLFNSRPTKEKKHRHQKQTKLSSEPL